MNDNKPKPIPVSIKKEAFIKLYHPMSEKFIREEINAIILRLRRVNIPRFASQSDDQLVKSHFIFKAEFEAFAATYGVPDGYELEKAAQ